MTQKPPLDKSLTYVGLLEALGKRGCPVCRLMEEYSLDYLDTLFYEQVNDVGIRRKLRKARGFCNWHAWQARGITTSALGVAIIAKDLLGEELTRLDALLRSPLVHTVQRASRDRIPRKSLLAFIQGWRRKGRCPACHIIVAHERHALETLLDFLRDPELASRFERSAGLCIVHTMRAAARHGSHLSFRRLIEMQRCHYARLGEELEEFCRKHDYRFSGEFWGSESDSWLRAIELLVGKPGVFGSEVDRTRVGHRITRRWATLIDRYRRWVGERERM